MFSSHIMLNRKLVAVATAIMIVKLMKCCPPICRCDSTKTVYCNERQINFIPDEIPEDTQTMHLQINIITNRVRMDNILSSLTDLKKLNLDENQLTSVPSGLLVTLQYASFANNDVRFVSKSSFNGLTSLVELFLDGNSIENQGISHLAFKGTRSLKILSFSSNKLKQFPENLPESLVVLHLENNQIEVISKTATRRSRNLKYLDLSENVIVQTQLGMGAIAALTSLVLLNFSQNKLTEIPIGLPKNIEELCLSENKIEFIYDSDSTHGSLKGLFNLKLDITGNHSY